MKEENTQNFWTFEMGTYEGIKKTYMENCSFPSKRQTRFTKIKQ